MKPWSLERGATLGADGSLRFAVWAPEVPRIEVRIGGEQGAPSITLERDDSGVHRGSVAEIGAGSTYVYRLDGERERPDPVSRFQPRGVHGPTAVVDPTLRRWSDHGWRGLTMADLVLYELHVGTFTEAGTFESVIDRLGALRDLGITAIELLPVAEFPGTRNWGYDGVHPYAAQSSYGGPEGLARLVDGAHAAGLGVILDVVYNHLGPEGNYLSEYGPYFTDRYRTPWGAAINFDGPDSDEVRRYFVDNALYWVTELHVDGLRLDAVHAIYDFGARPILEEITLRVHEQAALLGRRAVVIAESDLNDPRLVRERERGGQGLDGQWSDDFHHAVHAALTGERRGYYLDFGGVQPIAKALRDRFFFDGRPSAFRRRRHGAPADDVSTERFVTFLQNHDQVGNRAVGDRLSTLLDAEPARLATALLLLAPYVPLLFMGEEYGETRPFLYFVSHGDPELVEAVRRGRREEFARFDWPESVPDPQAEETFLRSKLDWSAREREPHAATLALHRQLLRLRREEPALRPGVADVRVACDPGEGWIVEELAIDEEVQLIVVFNVSAEPLEAAFPERLSGRWRKRFATDAAATGRVGPGALLHIGPWGVVVYGRDGEPAVAIDEPSGYDTPSR